MGQDSDPVEAFRTELQELYLAVRRPTYRGLEAHADLDGLVLRISTVGDLLNGPGTPRWATVQAFVGACARHAEAHRIAVPSHLVELDRWHARYRVLENTLADRTTLAGAQRAPAVRVARRRRTVVAPGQLPADLPTFAGRTSQLAELDRLCDPGARPQNGPSRQRGVRPAAVSIVNVLVGLLAVNGAHPMTLDTLSDGEARTLLANRLGTTRVAAEPDAVEQLITACARLPLALAITAARAHRFGFTLAALAAELREAGQRLDVLDTGDRASQIRAVFSWSYQALTPDAALLFRMLGLHPGPDISASAAASLAGQSRAVARRSLNELTRANLLTEHLPGRYTFHDLLRAYASDQVRAVDSAQFRHTATIRLLDYYLHSGYTADRVLNPTRESIGIAPARPGVAPDQLIGDGQALAWFAAEHVTLLAVVEHAAANDFDTHTWQLAWVLWAFLYPRGYWQQWVAVGRAAVAAAARLADTTAQIHANRLLAHAQMQMNNFDEAETLLSRTLELAARAGERLGKAHTHMSLCYLEDWRKRYASALEYAHHAHEMFQTLGYSAGQAEALTRISWSHAQLGEYQLALSFGDDALALHQTLVNREGQATTWHSMGFAHNRLGQYAQALICYHHALTLLRDLGNRFYEAQALVGLGDTLHGLGDLDAACDAWRQALIILDDLNHARVLAVRARLRNLAPPTVTPSPQMGSRQRSTRGCPSGAVP